MQLLCSCFVQSFHKEGNEYLKKLCHFYCHCKEEHEYFVYICKGHPFINKRMGGMQHKWTCKILGSYEICNFCVQVKYLINFRAYKICMRTIPKNMQQHLVPLDDFLKNEMSFSEPFLVLSNQKVNIKLDNPLEKYMCNVKKVRCCKYFLLII